VAPVSRIKGREEGGRGFREGEEVTKAVGNGSGDTEEIEEGR